MIRTFADRTTEVFFTHGICPAQWRSFAKVARRKLDMLNAAIRLQNLRSPQGTASRRSKETGRANGAFVSTISGACASDGPMKGRLDVQIVDYH